MRPPTIINYASAPVAVDVVGRLGQPAYVDIPKGVLAYVQLFAATSITPPSWEQTIMPGLAYEAELTTLGGNDNPEPLPIMPSGRWLLTGGASRPTAVIAPPAGKRLRWWPYLENIADRDLVSVSETPLVQVWLRALLLDEDTPPAQLAHLVASLL